jgi:hypothetical protein
MRIEDTKRTDEHESKGKSQSTGRIEWENENKKVQGCWRRVKKKHFPDIEIKWK